MQDPVASIVNWLRGVLEGWGLADLWVTVVLFVLGIVVMATVLLVFDIFLVWLERKIVARFQDRLGPNRLGPFGLIQPFADVIKLLIKEDITPNGADRFIYNLAPIIALATVLLLWAVIPFSPTLLGTDINVGVLYIVAVGAISVLGILMAGWASNNKYALLGAFRTVAQMVSYEVPMVLSLMIPVLLARSMGVSAIVESQGIWYIVIAPVAAMIFLLSSIAELGRAPFDLVEAESEIVAGFHIEYTGMKFGMFYAGELLHALTIGALFSSLFLGGWRGPFVDVFPPLGILYLFGKALFIYWVTAWIKYSLPRIRIDHMLAFNWKFLTPLALVVLMTTALADKLLRGFDGWVYVAGMILLNGVIAWATLSLSRRYVQVERRRFEANRPVAGATAYPLSAPAVPPSGAAPHAAPPASSSIS